MKTAIVIGTGAGGAMAAKELQGHFQVTVLEAGEEFEPFSMSVDKFSGVRKSGLLLDERMISGLFPAMQVKKASSGMVLVYGKGTGGTTTLATGNALRYDRGLKKIGIDLDDEFKELSEEIPVSVAHRLQWSPVTKALFDVCEELGFDPVPTGKMVDYSRCVHCGRCVLGCPAGAKWDSRSLLSEAIEKGAVLQTNCRVMKLETDKKDNSVKKVCAAVNGIRTEFTADLIVLAAGGLNTPVILDKSGIDCEKTLFVDPVVCVAGPYKDAGQDREIPMPFLMERNGYMLSPYMDYLSLFFNRSWHRNQGDILSMMIKLSDSCTGDCRGRKIEKGLSKTDEERFNTAIDDCKAILKKMGIEGKDMFLGTVNAGHPGGMLPLTDKEAESFHSDRLPRNLYVSDATLLPESMGNPPIWTIMALAKRIAKVCIETFG